MKKREFSMVWIDPKKIKTNVQDLKEYLELNKSVLDITDIPKRWRLRESFDDMVKLDADREVKPISRKHYMKYVNALEAAFNRYEEDSDMTEALQEGLLELLNLDEYLQLLSNEIPDLKLPLSTQTKNKEIKKRKALDLEKSPKCDTVQDNTEFVLPTKKLKKTSSDLYIPDKSIPSSAPSSGNNTVVTSSLYSIYASICKDDVRKIHNPRSDGFRAAADMLQHESWYPVLKQKMLEALDKYEERYINELHNSKKDIDDARKTITCGIDCTVANTLKADKKAKEFPKRIVSLFDKQQLDIEAEVAPTVSLLSDDDNVIKSSIYVRQILSIAFLE
ncbi:hypothetical protein MUCCIDRAFT_78424 [Mucor lusitanicus CBS 277.49]|uniref:Uncharacterized protein n=1 Tax=Mucor lusitanicus CBS 277.49 TaxID=747725 RepID=A0A168NNS0_MUCCL|nr:hypothetical protein MUCCIDRAFT_78424 [Mucor lusitanicus CBS 277.49]